MKLTETQQQALESITKGGFAIYKYPGVRRGIRHYADGAWCGEPSQIGMATVRSLIERGLVVTQAHAGDSHRLNLVAVEQGA